MWTVKFQTFKLDLWKAEEPEIKLPTFIESSKKQEFQKNIRFIDYAKAFDCVDHNKLWKTLKEIGIPDIILPVSWETCRQVKKQQVKTLYGTTDWFRIKKGVGQSYLL